MKWWSKLPLHDRRRQKRVTDEKRKVEMRLQDIERRLRLLEAEAQVRR